MSSPGFKAKQLHNAHDVDGLMAIGTPDAKFSWGEGQSMPWVDYVKECKDVFASFPDIHCEWSERSELNDGTVTSKVVVTGTHTGAPFGFGPFPPIEATGIKCQNDPECVEWIVEGDKLKEMKVTSPEGSTKTGPSGLYVQIGGRME